MNGISNIGAIGRAGAVDPVRVDDRDRLRQVEKEQESKETARKEQERRVDNAHPDADSVMTGVSVDGDTSRASRAGMENIKDGIVMKKSEAAAGSKEERPITSMTGYTDSQVEQLYYLGKISRQDYNEEMERRERRDEEAGVAEEKGELSVADRIKEDNKEKLTADKTENDRASADQTRKAQEADDARKAADEKAADTRKQLITEEMEDEKAFAKEMGRINAVQQDFSLRADAITQAIANDREKIVSDVIDAAEKVASGNPTQ